MQLLLVIFIAVSALSLLLQAGLMVGIAVTARRTQRKVDGLVDDMRTHALPVILSSRTMLDDLAPKIKAISANLTESSHSVRSAADEIHQVVGDVAARTRTQAAHVENMVGGTLDHITEAGNTLQHGLSIPLRQLNGVLNGIRAGVNVIFQSTPRQPSRSGSDGFI
jgi:ABC-type transporter Mla subunit MlaD